MSNLTGLIGPFLQPSEYGRNEAGQFTMVPYEDVNGDRINALAAQFDAQGYNYRVVHGFGKHRLEVQLPFPGSANEVQIDLWEFAGNKAQKDILTAAVPTGITGTLSQKNIEIIRNALGGQYPNGNTTVAQTDFTDGNPGNAFTMYNLMKLGVTDHIVIAPILRHTQTSSFQFPYTLTNLSVGLILSTPTLLAFENPPAWAVAGLPNDIPPGFQTVSVAFGWQKGKPSIQQIAGRKVQVITEFEYGLWSTATFGQPL